MFYGRLQIFPLSIIPQWKIKYKEKISLKQYLGKYLFWLEINMDVKLIESSL